MLKKLIQKTKEEQKNKTIETNSIQLPPEVLSFEYEYIPTLDQSYKILGIETVYYFPNFISEQFSKKLWAEVDKIHNSKEWHHLPHAKRRLLKIGGEVTQEGLQNQTPLPKIFQDLAALINKSGLNPKEPNHILLNEYPPGSGIMPHTDGPLYDPYVVILSQNSNAIFEFMNDWEEFNHGKSKFQLLVEPNSLLFFTGEAYHSMMHAIRDFKVDTFTIQVQAKKDSDKVELLSTTLCNNKNTGGMFSILSSKLEGMNWSSLCEKDIEEYLLNLNLGANIEIKLQKDTNSSTGIITVFVDRKTRRSLTIRHVPLAKKIISTKLSEQKKTILN